jgi:replicative DNA helicase
LVVVDYLQLMQMPKGIKGDNRAIGVGENSRMLKVIAKELKVPVLALAQLNRAAVSDERQKASARPQLSDLKDSGSIEQDADMVCFINRPNMGKGDTISEEEKREALLIIAKHRNGPTMDIPLSFDGQHTRFYDVEDPS